MLYPRIEGAFILDAFDQSHEAKLLINSQVYNNEQLS